LPLVLFQLPYRGLDWLSYEFVLAQYYYTPTPEPTDGGSDKKEKQAPDAITSGQAKRAIDPETPDIAVWFPQNAVSQNVHLEIQQVNFEDLPGDTTALAQAIDQPFFFGAYIDGTGTTVKSFNESVVIFVKYNDDALGANTDETMLRMYLYNPAVDAWVKLCSRVDVHGNVAAGMLASPIPFEDVESSLLAISLDNTPPLEQVTDRQGATIISLPDSNFQFRVLPGTVDVGAHFEITQLPEVVNSGPITLLNQPIDVKLCSVDQEEEESSRQLTNLPKPIEVQFGVSNQAARLAGGSSNLTIAYLEDETDWVDVQDAGFRVTAGNNQVSIDTDEVGTFSLAAP
jgi:hypothetical protein